MEKDDKLFTKKHIVFDMRFLVQPNPTEAVRKLGLIGLSQSLYSGNFNTQDTIRELFGMVKLVELNLKAQDNETVTHENQRVPSAMVSWLKGKVTCNRMLELVKGKIAEQYWSWLTSRMNTIADMAFDPETCTDVLSPCNETFTLIAQLQKEGHRVHALGNWHTDVGKKITSRFLSSINGRIVFSGDLGQVKCKEHSKIYTTFLSNLSVNYSQVCFVETSETYYKQLKLLSSNNSSGSLTTILSDPSSLNKVKDQLRKKGLLSSND